MSQNFRNLGNELKAQVENILDEIIKIKQDMFDGMRFSQYKKYQDSNEKIELILKNEAFAEILSNIEAIQSINSYAANKLWMVVSVLEEIKSPALVKIYIESISDVDELVDNNGNYSRCSEIENMIGNALKIIKSMI